MEVPKVSFVIINDKLLRKLGNIHLTSSFPTKEESNTKEWICECKNGDILRINYTAGLVSMLRGPTEYDTMGSPRILKPVIGIDRKEDIKKCTFKDIKLFMNWKIRKDKYLS